MKIREIQKSDIADILKIRISTKENPYTMEQLAKCGITEESISDWIEGTVKGWIYKASDKPVGFSMGNSATGEIIVVAVCPGYEKLGIGKLLMTRLQDWLWSFGHEELWLWADPDPSIRASGFYRKLGWESTGQVHGNDEMLKLKRI